jgi:sortase A
MSKRRQFVAFAALVLSMGLSLSTVSPAQAEKAPKIGEAIAEMTAPRLGATWKKTIYEGTSLSKVLTPLGPGHYTMTQMPGQLGNFAVAGHRFGSGGPFLNIDKFRKGDLVFVKTKASKFTYRFVQAKVVLPSEVGVLLPMPKGLTAPHASDALLTLQTCTPVHINTKRLIVWFELVSTK